MNERERYDLLRNSIRVFSTKNTVSFDAWAQLRHERGYVESTLRNAARFFGGEALKEGLFEIKEWDDKSSSFGDEHIIQLRAEVINPKAKPGHFAAQIDKARREGIEEAAAMVKERAARFAALDDYGPVQALALNSMAVLLLEKSKRG